jgi:hypothetical protein
MGRQARVEVKVVFRVFFKSISSTAAPLDFQSRLSHNCAMDSQATPPPLPMKTVFCSECENPFSPADVVMIQNAPVCGNCKPIVVQRLKEGATAIRSGLWRDGDVLIAALAPSVVSKREATLPDRCVKCNAPANGYKLGRKMQWHPSGWYALIILNLIIYAIVASIISKRAKIDVGLCPAHQAKRRNAILTGWAIFAVSVGCFIYGGVFSNGWVAAVGILCLIAAPIYGIMRGQVLSPKKIDDSHAYLKGACAQYLDSLPRWS